MNENRMIMIMFFIIDSVEFESGMCVIYRNIQWILLAWHAFFILSSTCKHDKTLCVAPTSAVRVGICFFGPFFLQLSFFVLNSCPKLCTYLFWFWKRNCQVHQQRTFEHQQGNVLKVVRDVITPPTPPNPPVYMSEHPPTYMWTSYRPASGPWPHKQTSAELFPLWKEGIALWTAVYCRKIHNPKWLTFPRNKEPMEIFSELTAEPVAAASLGQARRLGSQLCGSQCF